MERLPTIAWNSCPRSLECAVGGEASKIRASVALRIPTAVKPRQPSAQVKVPSVVAPFFTSIIVAASARSASAGMASATAATASVLNAFMSGVSQKNFTHRRHIEAGHGPISPARGAFPYKPR